MYSRRSAGNSGLELRVVMLVGNDGTGTTDECWDCVGAM